MSRILSGDTMVPIIESDYILILGYSILYKEYNLTRFDHQKKRYSNGPQKDIGPPASAFQGFTALGFRFAKAT